MRKTPITEEHVRRNARAHVAYGWSPRPGTWDMSLQWTRDAGTWYMDEYWKAYRESKGETNA